MDPGGKTRYKCRTWEQGSFLERECLCRSILLASCPSGTLCSSNEFWVFEFVWPAAIEVTVPEVQLPSGRQTQKYC